LQANLGDLDNPASRRRLVIGNLALLQVQSLIAGCIAGLFSFILGILIRPSNDASTYYESMLVVSSSMLAASLSSLILGIFMCILIILSRRFNVDPGQFQVPKTYAAVLKSMMNLTPCYFGFQTTLLALWHLL